MRISDWSSDVCSSDLVHARIAAVQRLDRGHRVQVDDVAAVDPHEAVRIELRGDAGDGAAQRVVPPAHAQVHVVAGGLQPFNVAGGHEEFAAQLADRSEEHTSELQSLIRNPYAVFCLEK